MQRLRRLKCAVHALNIAHCTADAFVRQLEREIVIRLEQNALRLHQTVAHSAVGRFTEIAAFGMLDVGASGDECDVHIGQRRAGQHAEMRLLREVRQNKPLPVEVEFIGRAGRCERDAAPPLARLHEQMHLGVMPQRLEMTDADDRLRDGLPVDDAALVKGHAHTEARLDQLGQYLELHLTHQLQVDLTQLFVPDDTQQRVLFLELP